MIYTGYINIPKKALNYQELAYFLKICKNAKCTQIDVFYASNCIYIGADSLETHLLAMYKIPLTENASKSVKMNSTEVEEVDNLDSLFSSDIFDTAVEFAEEVDLAKTNSSDIKSFSPQLTPPQPLFSNADEKREILYFSTITEFISALLINDEYGTDTVQVNITEETVTVVGATYDFTYPSLRCYNDLNFYLDTLAPPTEWEKVDVEVLQRISKAVSITTQENKSNMYITLEGDDIYSDNMFMLVRAKSYKLNKSYTFTYTMMAALTNLPVKNVDVSVSKSNGLIFLKINNIYYGWTTIEDNLTDNIFNLVNTSVMSPVVTLSDKDLKRLKIFSTLTCKIQTEEDKVIELYGIENGALQVTQSNNHLICNTSCRKGIAININVDTLFTAVRILGVKSPTLYTDLDNLKSNFLQISGNGLDLIIRTESLELRGDE